MPARDSVVLAVDALVGWLQGVGAPADDSQAIERIAALERLQAAAAGAQAVELAAFERSRIQADEAAGLPSRRRGGDVAAQVGLAVGMSPSSASRLLTRARALTQTMPETLRLLRSGQIWSWIASIVVRETSALEPADQTSADSRLAERLPALGPRQAEAAVRRIAITLDPASPLRRSRTARSDRRVSIRPAPDTMTLLTGFLPVEQGVAAWASLDRHAKSLKSQGDERGIGQIMADTMVERLTGQVSASATPIEVGVVISAGALTGQDETPAAIAGGEPIPAQVARDIIATSARAAADVWLRRLIADPVDGSVTAIDSRRRRYEGPLATLIDRRDQTCRTPSCGAPIRHHDHIEPWRETGSTTVDGGQGLCAHHNQVKEHPGWRTQRIPQQQGHHTAITTPTGHRYLSQAPPALGP